MDLPALLGFIAVAEERHFRRAALRLHMSQPPLSARIRGLELELGVRLFHRGPGAPVSLTPAGVVLLPFAREIVALVDSAKGAVGRVRRAEVGELSVAVAAGIQGRLLGHAVRRFRAGYPNVDLRLSEMDAAQQLAELSAGRVDVAVIRHVGAFGQGAGTVLAEHELGIACPCDDPLAAHDTVDPRDLGDGRVILVPGGLAPLCQQVIVEHCRSLGFEPTGRYGSTGPESFLEALGASSGRSVAALAPKPISDNGNDPGRLAWRPLKGGPLVLATSALVDTSHDWAAARSFVDALVDGALGGREPTVRSLTGARVMVAAPNTG
jgi:DNA-binding transcriptional LysR family regulator